MLLNVDTQLLTITNLRTDINQSNVYTMLAIEKKHMIREGTKKLEKNIRKKGRSTKKNFFCGFP